MKVSSYFSLAFWLPVQAATLCSAQKYAFAHVVVGNTAAHTQETWANDISLAAACGIDAFVLNMGYPDSNIPTQVANAFAAAEAAGSSFKLLFAFDYLGGGQTWPATGSNSVVSYLQEYQGSAAYFKYNGLPFVSTFEGTGANIADWAQGGAIRSAVPVYFVPDWSSLGPTGIQQYLDNIDGFFNWGMWPDGASNMTDSLDKQYQSVLGSKSYMMGVSPWFFHSASGGKDWVWRGDDLWADRWAETLDVNPEFVQIVSWNDFAEAHYIGPIYTDSEIAAGSAIYVDGMPHESWRDFIPYYIAKFKGSTFDISRDQMQYWYHPAPTTGGSTCGVVGNNADQSQSELSPNLVVEDGVFFSALLSSAAKVHVQIGTNPITEYDGAEGINHWSQPFNGQTGVPTFSVVRNGVTSGSGTGIEITASTTLSNGCTNYNAWVGSF
ncbi:related to mutanase [Phialocephala subalpina]|uniref:Related to mutanase n=1 Tax=Phialocephala subalpina TaxID=576137 RepID=A0A1L7WDU0_9HELO|nr:related to mutanase [Phialocephala subalpina]